MSIIYDRRIFRFSAGIPDYCWKMIFQYLTYNDLRTLTCVNSFLRGLIIHDFCFAMQRVGYCLDTATMITFKFRKTRFKTEHVLKSCRSINHKYTRHPGFPLAFDTYYALDWHMNNASYIAWRLSACIKHHCVCDDIDEKLCTLPNYLKDLEIYHSELYDEIKFVKPWVFFLIKKLHNL